MKKRLIACVLCLSCLFSLTPVFAAAQEKNQDGWHKVTVLSEIIKEDGSSVLTIRDASVVKTLHFKLVNSPALFSAQRDLSWEGWGEPTTVQYNATAEQTLQSMSQAALRAFLGSALGIGGTVLGIIVPPLYDAIQANGGNGEKTIWLERTIWLKNDYSAYRRQDNFYKDENFDELVYSTGIKEFIGGNR